MDLKHSLSEQIRERGGITVADYMAQCIAHYYATQTPFGRNGDFITSPGISQIFGELIGAWVAYVWQANDEPHALLCELGPGEGILMHDLLRATCAVPGFHAALEIRMIEASEALQQKQQAKLASMHTRIRWQEKFESLPPLPLFLIANEFFDALPVHQYVGDQEREVQLKNNEFCFYPESDVTRETSPDSIAVMNIIAGHIAKYGGAALIVDYGYTGTMQGDTLQAMHQHHPVDVLHSPGKVDLTAHVDFHTLAEAARAQGTHAFVTEQGAFLKRLGAELRAAALCKNADAEAQKNILSGLERLTAPHAMGTLFKVLAVTSALENPAGF